MKLSLGTKSVLFGAHAFWLHPFFVAAGWTKLYGFPWDPRLWIAFMVHDIGYIGKRHLDDAEGERHVELGAAIMRSLFGDKWGDFCLYHSRHYAKLHGQPPSKLCFADKLAFPLTPAWLYLPMVTATGEIEEYLDSGNKGGLQLGRDKKQWHSKLKAYMTDWVEIHKDGRSDTWTNANRNGEAQ